MALKVVKLYKELITCLSDPSLRVNVPPAFYALLHRSRVVENLAAYFRTGSIMEMTSQIELGIAMMDLVRVLGSNKFFLPLLRPNGTKIDTLTGSHYSISKFLKDMQKR